MNRELTNLLPYERQRALFRENILRVCVVAVVLVTLLTLVSAVLLFPTYVFLAKSYAIKEGRLASIESAISSADGTAFSARLSALSGNVEVLSKLGSTRSVSEIIRMALAIPHSGAALSGFTYAPATGKNSGTLTVSGTAASRDSLRNYQTALQSAPFSASAVLPVSAYAKDSDIAFTITVTLVP
ncbi:MAG: hypothetical protein AAB517_01910 [Patescibacteria group bacterium]